jgi:hypothetical protein
MADTTDSDSERNHRHPGATRTSLRLVLPSPQQATGPPLEKDSSSMRKVPTPVSAQTSSPPVWARSAGIAVYLALLHGGTKNADKGDGGAVITREQHLAAYEVSPAPLAFEERQAALISAAEPARAEGCERRLCALCGMRCGCRGTRDGWGGCAMGGGRGEQERREAFERWCAERGGE